MPPAYVPALQLPHAVVEELSTSAIPAAHAAHILPPASPSVSVELPEPQRRHALAPGDGAKKPGVQLEHTDQPLDPEYRPATHTLQFVPCGANSAL